MPARGAPSAMPAADPSETVLSTVIRFLRSFSRQGPLLVALSGGSDSSALLVAFAMALRAREFSGFTLHAATVDHGLRPGSEEEAQEAGRLAQRYGVPHRILTWTGPKPQTGLQAQARGARYTLLRGEALRTGALAILLGHTLGDQRETVAMRAARGAGEGLSGMAPSLLLNESVWALRPFLDLERETLRALLLQEGVRWTDDPSNANPHFERVRLRQGPGDLSEVLCTSGLLRLAEAERQAAWLETHGQVIQRLIGFVRADALAEPLCETASAGLFKLAGALRGAAHLPPRISRERLVRWLAKGEAGRMTLGGMVFDRRRSGLWLYREARDPGVIVERGGERLWDGRFALPPGAGEPALLAGEGAEAFIRLLCRSGVPEAVARRAARAAPDFPDNAISGSLNRDAEGALAGDYRLAAYAEFLSGYEWPVAVCLRHLFALPELPAPPVSPRLLSGNQSAFGLDLTE